MHKTQSKLGKNKRFLAEHPHCCFCGGVERATTLDHVPPKACFPDGYWPEEFEFPACQTCNVGTKKADLIFGFYTMLLDFSVDSRSPANLAKLGKLKTGIIHNCPDALPNLVASQPIFSTGRLVTPVPLALEIGTPPAFRDAATTIAEKLTHALYYRERGKAVTGSHLLLGSSYQPQRSGAGSLTDFFVDLLPDQTIGKRSNLKPYGDRFAYRFGVKEEEDLFLYAAQFGRGLIIWGIVIGPGLAIGDLHEPLRNAPWRRGAGGRGTNFQQVAPRTLTPENLR